MWAYLERKRAQLDARGCRICKDGSGVSINEAQHEEIRTGLLESPLIEEEVKAVLLKA